MKILQILLESDDEFEAQPQTPESHGRTVQALIHQHDVAYNVINDMRSDRIIELIGVIQKRGENYYEIPGMPRLGISNNHPIAMVKKVEQAAKIIHDTYNQLLKMAPLQLHHGDGADLNDVILHRESQLDSDALSLAESNRGNETIGYFGRFLSNYNHKLMSEDKRRAFTSVYNTDGFECYALKTDVIAKDPTIMKMMDLMSKYVELEQIYRSLIHPNGRNKPVNDWEPE